MVDLEEGIFVLTSYILCDSTSILKFENTIVIILNIC